MVSPTSDPAIHLPSTCQLSMSLLFGSILFATTALATRTYLMGDYRIIYSSSNPKATPLDLSSLPSTYTLLYHSTVFGMILFWAYMCEFHPPYPHSEKSYDRDEFMMLTVLLFVAAAFTVSKNDKSGTNVRDLKAGKIHTTITNKHHQHGHHAHAHHGGGGGAGGGVPERKMSDLMMGQPAAMGGQHHRPHHETVVSMTEATPVATTPNSGNGTTTTAMVDVNLSEEDVQKLIVGAPGGTTTPSATPPIVATPPSSSGIPIHHSHSSPHHHYGTALPTKACNDVLNRDQTEEWKGWMQYMFLLYHYYHAEDMYNAIRIMITCYVWMTGFGNFSFFYLKDDYSTVRVLQMLWRLNFLVVFLCLSQGTTYILYYICPLHTFFFLMVYVTMRVGRQYNYSRYGLRLKLMVLALIIYFVWDVNTGLFQFLHYPILNQIPQLGAGNGTMWEWYFRSTLDHWSTFLGMVFASNFPIISLFYRKLESQPFVRHWSAKIIVGMGFAIAFTWWATGPYMSPKLRYNETNSYFGFIPMMTYIYFRNITPTMRSYSLDLLHQIGKTTLETYLMQHHIWLTSDAKSLLTLIPGWPKVNMVLVTVMYYVISRRLYKLTLFLRGMLLPDDVRRCYYSLAILGTILIMFYALAYSMESIDVVGVGSVCLVAMLVGLLLYQTVLDMTWNKYYYGGGSVAADGASSANGGDGGMTSESGASSTIDPMNNPNSPTRSNKRPMEQHRESVVSRMTPPLIGGMTLLVVGLFYQTMALNGAGKILPLPSTCEAAVNDGTWVPVDGCNEYQRGVGFRNHETSGYASCSGTYVWGWHSVTSNSLCRFYHRPSKTLQKLLKNRKLVFIGDSMTRNVYHATIRALGKGDAGSYDATVAKHSDMYDRVGSTDIEFKWAPLAKDELQKLRELRADEGTSNNGVGVGAKINNNNNNGDGTSTNNKPDMVLIGGGAWDRLHLWATDEDQKSLKQTLNELAREMMGARDKDAIPVVWFNPTTINTVALQHEDKRSHMKEEDMVEIRAMYSKIGVWAASSFVLDGTAFTKDRVRESYDGVHYPPNVYDAGAQILANAMDWVILDREDDILPLDFNPPQPGKMANPFLGLMMLCIAFVGLFFFDGFLGFSYLASIFVKGVMPTDLYEEAFVPLHQKMKLPPVQLSGGGSGGGSGEEEIVSLVKGGGDLELQPQRP